MPRDPIQVCRNTKETHYYICPHLCRHGLLQKLHSGDQADRKRPPLDTTSGLRAGFLPV